MGFFIFSFFSFFLSSGRWLICLSYFFSIDFSKFHVKIIFLLSCFRISNFLNLASSASVLPCTATRVQPIPIPIYRYWLGEYSNRYRYSQIPHIYTEPIPIYRYDTDTGFIPILIQIYDTDITLKNPV